MPTECLKAQSIGNISWIVRNPTEILLLLLLIPDFWRVPNWNWNSITKDAPPSPASILAGTEEHTAMWLNCVYINLVGNNILPDKVQACGQKQTMCKWWFEPWLLQRDIADSVLNQCLFRRSFFFSFLFLFEGFKQVWQRQQCSSCNHTDEPSEKS